MGRQLEQAAADRFINLYGYLLTYVNAEYGILNSIENYDDLRKREDRELRRIRNRLYEEETEQLIGDFVAENPGNLRDDDLQTVKQWTEYEFGEFVVVRHLEDFAVFLDWGEPPQAFGVKAAKAPFEVFWEEGALPLLVSKTALLPFEGAIISRPSISKPRSSYMWVRKIYVFLRHSVLYD